MIEITKNHTGKMEGMVSISTSVFMNENCKKNHLIKGSICEHCFSHTLSKMYKELDQKNRRNTEILTKSVLPDEELPVFDPVKFPLVRLESFGDLNNETQLINYINIVKKNPDCRFSLYTKMYKIVLSYFSLHECPKNMNLVISSLFLNKPINPEPFYKTGSFEEGQLKVFTVYDYDYLHDHPEATINCGSRNCRLCQRCYSKNPTIYVNEILKTDQRKSEMMIDMRNPEKVDSIFKTVDAFSDLFL